MYKRQIAYLDLIEYGEKKGSKGFCKWEQKNEVHTLSFSISGLNQKQSGLVRIYAGEENVLGEMQIQNGRASETFVMKDFDMEGNSFFSKIRMPLEEGCELLAEFEVDTVCNELAGAGAGEIEEVQERRERQVTEDVRGESEAQETEDPLSSLWDILSATHELIHPFGTEAEYYRITLDDILLLKEKFHILRKNQFLFHGYYNYKYLILGKKEENSEEYWLGVPGIYHEREKMAARMYGFEKFEGAKTPYGVGDLGYYLITVE